jgi:cytosine/uracil/thiamine/allantoin permease
MFFRLLKVIAGFAFMIWLLLDTTTAIGWFLGAYGLLLALCGIFLLIHYVIVGPRTPEQVAKDDIAVNNIKNLLKNG